MSETRKLAAILVADVVGYSRLAGADEDRTLARLRGLRSDLIDPAIAAHRGRIVKRTGDGSIIEFRSVVHAVRCAIEYPERPHRAQAAGVPEDRRIEFRVGIHVGDVVEESDGDQLGTASISPRDWRGSPRLARFAFGRRLSGRSAAGSRWRSPISGRPNSRTSTSQFAPIRCRSGSLRGRSRRQRRGP